MRNSIAVINAVRPRSGKVDMQKVVDHFSRRCRAVRQVPFDPHLEEGAEISLDRLKPETREALIELAAVVADGFPGAQRPDDRSASRASLLARVLSPWPSRRRKSGSSSGPITRVFGRAGRRPRQPPAGVDQAGQDENRGADTPHRNLLDLNIRAVGRLGPCLTDGPGSRLVVDVLAYVAGPTAARRRPDRGDLRRRASARRARFSARRGAAVRDRDRAAAGHLDLRPAAAARHREHRRVRRAPAPGPRAAAGQAARRRAARERQ